MSPGDTFAGRTVKNTFRSMRIFNYRLWAMGAIVSNIGTWMQRVAQDWLVLTELTDHSASAVGIVTALQFAPQLLMLPVSGHAADHIDRRKLLLATQAAMGLLALLLGVLTLTHRVKLWHVYGFAFLLGCATALDAPARHTFVSELVGEADLSNAVALNATSFNSARMLGPALAGLLIGLAGTGWVFVANGVSFGAVLVSLFFIRVHELRRAKIHEGAPRRLAEGFRYLKSRPDLVRILVMFSLIGTFGLHFPIFVSAMAVNWFHQGAGRFGLATSVMAMGSVTGALLSASRSTARAHLLAIAAAGFALGLAVAAKMPTYLLFCLALSIVGVSAQTFTTTANGLVQLGTEPHMRGRVMAILLAVSLGATPVGAPFLGWVADRFGPPQALLVGASAAVVAAFIGARLVKKPATSS